MRIRTIIAGLVLLAAFCGGEAAAQQPAKGGRPAPLPTPSNLPSDPAARALQIDKELVAKGCRRFMNRADEYICEGMGGAGVAACTGYLKQGVLKVCLSRDDPEKNIRAATPEHARDVLIKNGCKQVGARGVFDCSAEAAKGNGQAICRAFRNYGAVTDCTFGTPRTSLTVVKNTVPGNSGLAPASMIFTDETSYIMFQIEMENAERAADEYAILYTTLPPGTNPFPVGCDGWQNQMVLKRVKVNLANGGKFNWHGKFMVELELSQLKQLKPPYSIHFAAVPLAPADPVKITLGPGGGKAAQGLPAAVCASPPSAWVGFHVPGAFADEKKKRDEAYAAAVREAYDVKVLSYVPPKFKSDPDAQHYFVMGQNMTLPDGRVWTKGCSFMDSKAFNALDEAKPLTQQAWDILSGTLNMASAGYESAKNWAVGAVADQVPDPPGCGAKCRGNLKSGLEYALVYAGVPPSIPNTTELYSRGSEYLAATVAEKTVETFLGAKVPTDSKEATFAKDKAYAAAYKASKAGIDRVVNSFGCANPAEAGCGVDGANPYTWGPPDPTFRPRPAVLYVKVTPKPGARQGDHRMLKLHVKVERDDGGASVLAPDPATYDIPSYIPPKGLIIPVVLWPVIKGKVEKRVSADNDPVLSAFAAKYFGYHLRNDEGTHYFDGGQKVRVTIMTRHDFSGPTGNSLVLVPWEDSVSTGYTKGTYGIPKWIKGCQ